MSLNRYVNMLKRATRPKCGYRKCALAVTAGCILIIIVAHGKAGLRRQFTAIQALNAQLRAGNVSLDRAVLDGSPGGNQTAASAYLARFKSPYIKERPIDPGFQSAHDNRTVPSAAGGNTSEVTPSKLVVLFDAPSWLKGTSSEFFGACPVTACVLSYSHARDGFRADAVVFHDVPAATTVIGRTSPRQVFVFMHMESPAYTSDRYKSTLWNTMFNWTWTYRVDADIFTPVGFLRRATSVPSRPFLRSLWRAKDKAVAWFSSNCNVRSRRDQYVSKLRRVIPVDVYGKCGELKCTGPACTTMLSTNYMFYLSFENSFCRDYVTEKFFKVFADNVHVIPVVRGGANYSLYFPSGTYVDSETFAGPEALGRHLLTLMADEEVYVDMLWRAAHFRYHQHGMIDAKCQLCYRLHNMDRFVKTYSDLYAWNHNNTCHAPREF